MVSLSVLTMRDRDRDLERDIDAMVLKLRGEESGMTSIDEVEVSV